MHSKTALITGASSGIGAACAYELAKIGYNLILLARRGDKLQTVADAILAAYNVNVFVVVVDITDYPAVNKLISDNLDVWGDIDILVNNAGVAIGLDQLPAGEFASWQLMFNTNVLGLLNITQQILPAMVERNSGHIINIGSISSHEVYAGGTVYCATKHAEKAITKGLSLDLNNTNIKVTSVDPGMVQTEFSKVRFNNDVEKFDKVYDGFEPLSASDVADAVLYVATRPAHVKVAQLTLLPTAQASVTTVNRKK